VVSGKLSAVERQQVRRHDTGHFCSAECAAAVTTVDVAGSPLLVTSQIKSQVARRHSSPIVICASTGRRQPSIAKACNYHIHALRHVRQLLTDETARTVACSIAARLDYCNAVLYGACHGGDAEQTTTCTEQPSQGGVLTWWPGRCSTSAQVTTLASA